MDWHVRFGIIALALLVFRIIWGFAGPRYARFSQFVCGPVAVWHYVSTLSKQNIKLPGHNPLGALSVLAMLGVVGVQAITGLFANDDILTQGPFSQFVSDATSSFMTSVHQWNETFLFAVIALHLLAILVYSMKGQSLIGPMIHGDVEVERLTEAVPPARDDLLTRVSALLLISTLLLAAWWLIRLAEHAGSSFN